MPQTYDLLIEKRVSVLNRECEIDYKGLFIHLGKAVVKGSFGKVSDSFEHIIEAATAIGLQDKPEQIAWVLISKALMRDLHALLEDSQDLFTQVLADDDLAELAERVTYTLEALDVTLDARFFENPKQLPWLDEFRSALVFWLQAMGLTAQQADNFHLRFKDHFVLALHEEWGENPEFYQQVLSSIDTPFTAKTLEQRAWQQYTTWLTTLASERVFNESFTLKQVYIRLRSYHIEKNNKEGEPPEYWVVGGLHQTITGWVENFTADDPIRIVSGGPGSGKSSFAKVLAAELATAGQVPVLFIPLHHLHVSASLRDTLASFVENDAYLRANPLDIKDGQARLLLIFDGLDELSMQGQAAEVVAQGFVDEVIRALDQANSHRNIRWQALITGRDLAIQANASRFRKPQQVLHVLPYFVEFGADDKKYQGNSGLLKQDQRDEWWQKLSMVKGLAFDCLPKPLSLDSLQPITQEPLLNYLLSLSFLRQKIVFNEETNLNAIYYDLLEAVYERQYAGRHAVIKQLTFNDFLEILEEIALAIWHGNGRTASASYLYQRCEENHLTDLLEQFSEDAKKGVVRLLTAFYFREFGKDAQGDKTFEFTHKSFGEYLTARRIIKQVKLIAAETKRYQSNRGRGGWSTEEALITWVKTCGKTAIDNYLLNFLEGEVAEKGISGGLEMLKSWQQCYLHLVQHVVKHHAPMEKVGLDSFAEMLRQSRNAEEALMVIHYVCAKQTEEVLPVDWGKPTNFGRWLKRIQEQRMDTNTFIIVRMLAFVDLRNTCLMSGDLHGAKLRGSILSHVNLRSANLNDADLRDTDLEGGDLSDVELVRANLRGSNLNNACLTDAILIDACLAGATLVQAELLDVKLARADLEGADLEGVCLRWANLEEGNLRHVNLGNADLRNVNLRKAELAGSNFTHIICAETNLEDAFIDLDTFQKYQTELQSFKSQLIFTENEQVVW